MRLVRPEEALPQISVRVARGMPPPVNSSTAGMPAGRVPREGAGEKTGRGFWSEKSRDADMSSPYVRPCHYTAFRPAGFDGKRG